MHSLLRMVVGFLFLCHGAQKVFGFPSGAMGKVTQLFTSSPGWSGVLELAGGALILIGFLTRPVAFILSGEMAFAYFMAHANKGFLPLVNHGELAVLYCFVFLYLAAAGAGPFSIDGMRKKA